MERCQQALALVLLCVLFEFVLPLPPPVGSAGLRGVCSDSAVSAGWVRIASWRTLFSSRLGVLKRLSSKVPENSANRLCVRRSEEVIGTLLNIIPLCHVSLLDVGLCLNWFCPVCWFGFIPK